MRVMCIDPGTTRSGVVICEGDQIVFAEGEAPNQEVCTYFRTADVLVIERFVMYSAGGSDCTETLLWSGRFWEAWRQEKSSNPIWITRTKVTSLLGLLKREAKLKKGSMDSKVIALMRDIYGEQTKTAHVTYHAWQALGLYEAFRRLENEETRRDKRPGRRPRKTGTIRLVYERRDQTRRTKGIVVGRFHGATAPANIQGRRKKRRRTITGGLPADSTRIKRRA